MAELNPYAKYLGGQDPLDVIVRTTERLETLLKGLSPAAVDRPPMPGKWSAREIVCHLADTELVFAFRLRQSLAQDNHVIQPYDQEAWALRYAAYDAATAMQVFKTTRGWNLTFLRAASPADFAKTLTHPERGTMTFRVLVETMGGHDLNHLGQVEAIAKG